MRNTLIVQIIYRQKSLWLTGASFIGYLNIYFIQNHSET
jgi:hypothetical protein